MSSRVHIPPKFARFADRSETWGVWLARLPGLVRDVLAEWAITVDGPAVHGECALVVPVMTAEGERAVVKFGWPHEEAEFEHLALREWGGAGAVRLLRADPRRSVLLLERASTRDLTALPVVEACLTVAGLYGRLHVPAPPQLQRLSHLCRQWSSRLLALPHEAPLPRRYVEQAAALARDFATDDATDGRIVHTDLHFENVLAADREPWLAIDPKPLSGDPHFEVAPLLWNRWDEIIESGDVRRSVRERLHSTIDAASLDEDRASDWVVVRMMVNTLWELESPSPASDEKTNMFAECVVIAKAVQD
ncbi:MAG: aminoglycoside phosphotransferase family protein [Actinomycetota bacterium]|nr:aminoglycoside phosphotransferase family protein [Actinomycetota bacterium]